MTDDVSLVDALRAAGHTDVAERLRDTTFARQLREAGHDDIAEALEQKLDGEQPTPEPTTAAAPDPQAEQRLFAEGYARALGEARSPWLGADDAA